jgi:class 3 adenylate cyclase/tetratricopeptide (TPR) repeat protein
MAAPVAERRLVTVLFADLVGFTPFAAARDAEDVRAMLTRYFDLASEVITRYGGTVEKFIGDAVMAVWGAPTAREDDAELAVRAALDLVGVVRELGPTIQARAGVLTGEAAVTLGAINQGMVAGDIVNTAARLQSVAQPGTVLVGESTMRATTSAIAYEPAGDQELKGKASPVPAFRALRVVAEVGGRNRQEGLEAPFVGRDDEMRALKDQFHATAKDRRVRLVSVIGPAGIGKSRLAWELAKYIDGLVDTVWWHQGRSPAYGNGIAYWALGEMVRGRCGLLESDDEATTRARVTATLEQHVPDPAERAWIEPALLTLLGLGGRGGASDQLFAAWRTFFERLAATAPVVLLFEDLHWADTGTLDFIDHLLDWTRDLPIAILTLARPELIDRRPDWGAGRRYFTSLFLEPLPEPVMRELLAGLVPGLPPRAVAAIVARADGVPLYAVETVRSLLADGRLVERDGRYEPVGDLSELAVPESLTALIASRLDALDPVDRSLLQDAAVLGQSFGIPALASLSGVPAEELEPRLRVLVRRELLTLEADPRSPERGQYSFVQALIREVAYNTLAKRDRRAKHLAAARWFESLGSDELAGALARHYLAAWQNTSEGPEADALAGQARLALKAAAERAVTLHAHDQAIELFTEALTVTTDPAERVALIVQSGPSYVARSRYLEMEQAMRQARSLAIESGDWAGEAVATTELNHALGTILRRAEAQVMVEETWERVRGHLPDRRVLRLQRQMAGNARRLGDPVRWAQLLEEIMLAAERIGDRELVYEALYNKGSSFTEMGRSIEGMALLQAVIDGAPAMGREDLATNAQVNLGAALMDVDPRGSLEMSRSLIERGRRTGDRSLIVVGTLNGAEAAIRTGDWAWAASTLPSVLEEATEPMDRLTMLEVVTNLATYRGDGTADLLAQAELLVADEPELRELLDERMATVAFVAGDLATAAAIWIRYGRRDGLNAPAAYAKAARALLWHGDAAGARAVLGDLEAIGLMGGAAAVQRATLGAGIDALEGRRAEAKRAYREALAQWQDLRLPWDEALTGMDMVLVLGADDADAVAAGRRALEILGELGARPFVAKLTAALGEGSAPTDAPIVAPATVDHGSVPA